MMMIGGVFGGSPKGRHYDYYDTLRKESGSTAEVVYVVEEGTLESSAKQVQLRHLTTLFSMSPSPFASFSVETAAAALLAVHHYNNGINTVMPQMSRLTNSCPLRFTVEVLDATTTPIGAARTLQGEILPRLASRIQSSDKNTDGSQQEAFHGPVPTALFGSMRSSSTLPISILSGIYKLPQISGSAASPEFDQKDIFPYLARLITSSDDETYRAASFFRDILKSTHVGVIYQRDTYGINYMKTFQSIVESERIELVTSSVPFTIEDTPKELESSVRVLCQSGYRHILAILIKQQVSLVIEEAYRQGCIGEGFVWVFSAFPPFDIKVKPSSAIIPALRGAAAIYLAAPSPVPTSITYSRFFEVWPRAFRTKEQLDYLWNIMPASVTGPGGVMYGRTSFPINPFPFLYTPNAYDCIMALIDASCRAAQSNENFTGPELFEALLETDFQGTSGRVAFNKTTGSRKFGSVPYVVAEMVPSEVGDDGLVEIKSNVKYVYESTRKETAAGDENTFSWFLLPNQTFRYSDGSAIPPPSLPPVQESHFKLTAVMRAFGLSLSATTLIASVLFAAWTIRWRNIAVVRAAQPIFLVFVCVGTFLMASSLALNGLPEPTIHPSQQQQHLLNAVCMAIPWLFSLGFVITFSSLFAKLCRVNKIFNHSSHHRVTVREKDVLLPSILLLLLLLSSLLVATILSPLSYQRVSTGVMDEYDRPIEFYCTCQSQDAHSHLWTLVNFFFLVVLLVTVREAYRARGLPSEFSESRCIFLSMVLISEAIAISLPIYFLGSPRMQYITVSVVVPLICLALLVPIFLSKMLQLNQEGGLWSRHRRTIHLRSSAGSFRTSNSRMWSVVGRHGGGVLEQDALWQRRLDHDLSVAPAPTAGQTRKENET